MLTRRDIAAFAWYGVLFSAVVCWAALRRGDSGAAPHNQTSDHDLQPLGQNDQNATLRRAVGRMVTQ